MINVDKYDAAINRGVSLLDSTYVGWENDIDLEFLEMSTGDSCVIGQLAGDYTEGVDALGIIASDYGFETIPAAGDVIEGYEYLNFAWSSVIAERQGVS